MEIAQSIISLVQQQEDEPRTKCEIPSLQMFCSIVYMESFAAKPIARFMDTKWKAKRLKDHPQILAYQIARWTLKDTLSDEFETLRTGRLQKYLLIDKAAEALSVAVPNFACIVSISKKRKKFDEDLLRNIVSLIEPISILELQKVHDFFREEYSVAKRDYNVIMSIFRAFDRSDIVPPSIVEL